jgi:hypothetical protein
MLQFVLFDVPVRAPTRAHAPIIFAHPHFLVCVCVRARERARASVCARACVRVRFTCAYRR